MSTEVKKKSNPLASPWKAMLIAVALMILGGLIVVVLQSILQATLPLDNAVSGILSEFAGTLSIAIIAVLMYKQYVSAGFNTLPKRDIRWIFIGMLFGLVFFGAFATLIQLIGSNHREIYFKEIGRYYRNLESMRLYASITMLITSDILVPVLEETLFRGFIFRSLANRHGVYIAVAVSSILFAFTHIGSNIPFLVLFMMAFGVVSSLLAYFSGKLVASYYFHITYNVFIDVYAVSQSAIAGAQLSN